MGGLGHLRLNPKIARTVDLPGLNDLQVFVVLVEPPEPLWGRSDGPPSLDQTGTRTRDDIEITNCLQSAIFTRGPPANPRSTNTQ
jgi:hypothetical protein